MNEKQAIAALKKMYGKNAAWRRNEAVPVGEEREAVLATLPALSEARDKARAARDARRAELLRDPLYVQLLAECKATEEARDKVASLQHSRRVTVGSVSNGAGMSFFNVRGEGDNWQEAIDAAKAKEQS